MSATQLANLTTDGWAALGGPTIKAANSRHLAPWLHLLAIDFFEADSPRDVSIRAMTLFLKRSDEILYGAGLFLSPEQKVEFEAVTIGLGEHMQALRSIAHAAGENLWQISPKMHYVQHLTDQSELINPRVCQNYSFEGTVGRITTVWKRTVAGPYKRLVQQRVLLKLLGALLIRFGVLDIP